MKRKSVFMIIMCLIFIFSSCGEMFISEEALDKAVSEAILYDNEGAYGPGEVSCEGHIIMGFDRSDDIVKAYTLTSYGEYEFQDGFFVNVSGGVMPAVITFEFVNNELKFKSVDYPQDGTEYRASIRKMFPLKYEKKVLNKSEKDFEILKELETKQAESYLKTLNRKAHIMDLGNITSRRKNFFEYGVDYYTLMKNCNYKYENYPDWIGKREVVENNVRFVYQSDYEKGSGNITYTKYNYNTKEIISEICINSDTGEIV